MEGFSLKLLVAVDLQVDFISGALGTREAREMLPRAVERIKNHRGPVIYTRDTHGEDYLETLEGKLLPVPHCIRDTRGWELCGEILELSQGAQILNKPTFGCTELPQAVSRWAELEPLEEIGLLGLCTDICVISNALLLKAHFPQVPMAVYGDCCAGVTPESHENALRAMAQCQIEIR